MVGYDGVAAVVVAVLALTAGCSGLSGNDGTPPANGTATSEETPTAEELPPLETREWANESGLNKSRLFLDLTDRLNDTSGYSINFTTTAREVNRSEGARWNSSGFQLQTDFAVEPGQAMYVVTASSEPGTPKTAEQHLFVDRSEAFFATFHPNGTRDSLSSGPFNQTVDGVAARWLLDRTPYATQYFLGPNTYEQAAGVDWTADGTTTHDGTPVYRFTGTRTYSGVFGETNLSRGVMYVDREGFVRDVTLEYTDREYQTGRDYQTERPFRTLNVTYKAKLTTIDEPTVDRPDWVEESE